MSEPAARLSPRQRKLLDAMGIDIWVSPDRLADVPAADGAIGVSVGGTPDQDWIALEQEVLSCTRCPLHRSRTQAVFGVGNSSADWLIIGEAPGVE
ncbi:MAG: uracil-DNA glycosylase, partial [Gammaproteobacteria bacterium]